MPELLRDCILVPIPKGKKDPTVLDNYHPIALASTLSKALEWCILLTYPDQSRYVHEGSTVYACFLDASKAFDLRFYLAGCWTEFSCSVHLPPYVMVQEPAHVRHQVGWLFL